MKEHYFLLPLRFAFLVHLFYAPQKIGGMETENFSSSSSSSRSSLREFPQAYSLGEESPSCVERKPNDTSDLKRSNPGLKTGKKSDASSHIPSIQMDIQKANSLSTMECSTSPGKERRKSFSIWSFSQSPGREGNGSTSMRDPSPSPKRVRNGSITSHDLKLDKEHRKHKKGGINAKELSSSSVSSMDCSISPERLPILLMPDSSVDILQLSQEKMVEEQKHQSPNSLSQTSDDERDQFLNTLELTDKDVTSPISGYLALILPKYKALTTLNVHLDRRDFHGNWIHDNVETFINHMTLTTLDLSSSWIRGSGDVMAKILTSNTILKVLKLGYCGLLNSDAFEIFQAVSTNSTLVTIALGFNILDEEEMRGNYVANALRNNTSLTALDLSGNNINVSSIESITGALTQILLSFDSSSRVLKRYQPQYLRTLSLDGVDLGDRGAELMGGVLSSNTVLTALSMRKNNIGALGASYIAQDLSNNTTLKMLDLRGNQMNSEVKKFLKKLKKNNTLKVLYSETDIQNDTSRSRNDSLDLDKKQKRQSDSEGSKGTSKK